MALPPQPFGNMVERGMGPAGPMDATSVDIPVFSPEEFACHEPSTVSTNLFPTSMKNAWFHDEQR